MLCFIGRQKQVLYRNCGTMFDEVKYLGVHITSCRVFKCSVTHAKRSFYKTANAIFGKIGRIASEEVILHLIKSKCRPIPVLLYGLDVCPLNVSDIIYGHWILSSKVFLFFRQII